MHSRRNALNIDTRLLYLSAYCQASVRSSIYLGLHHRVQTLYLYLSKRVSCLSWTSLTRLALSPKLKTESSSRWALLHLCIVVPIWYSFTDCFYRLGYLPTDCTHNVTAMRQSFVWILRLLASLRGLVYYLISFHLITQARYFLPVVLSYRFILFFSSG